MLKNNEERLNYIRDENNWTEVILSTYPHLKMRFLANTPFVRIYAIAERLWFGDTPSWHELGTYKMSKNSNLDDLYSYSTNQIITYLRENKI